MFACTHIAQPLTSCKPKTSFARFQAGTGLDHRLAFLCFHPILLILSLRRVLPHITLTDVHRLTHTLTEFFLKADAYIRRESLPLSFAGY